MVQYLWGQVLARERQGDTFFALFVHSLPIMRCVHLFESQAFGSVAYSVFLEKVHVLFISLVAKGIMFLISTVVTGKCMHVFDVNSYFLENKQLFRSNCNLMCSVLLFVLFSVGCFCSSLSFCQGSFFLSPLLIGNSKRKASTRVCYGEQYIE